MSPHLPNLATKFLQKQGIQSTTANSTMEDVQSVYTTPFPNVIILAVSLNSPITSLQVTNPPTMYHC